MGADGFQQGLHSDRGHASDAHAEVEITWTAYQRLITNGA